MPWHNTGANLFDYLEDLEEAYRLPCLKTRVRPMAGNPIEYAAKELGQSMESVYCWLHYHEISAREIVTERDVENLVGWMKARKTFLSTKLRSPVSTLASWKIQRGLDEDEAEDARRRVYDTASAHVFYYGQHELLWVDELDAARRALRKEERASRRRAA